MIWKGSVAESVAGRRAGSAAGAERQLHTRLAPDTTLRVPGARYAARAA